MPREMRIAGLTLLLLSSLIHSSCSTKALTPPRSEIIEEAKDDGITLLTIEEERAKFYAAEQAQQDKLRQLIEQRSSGAIRDANYRYGGGDELEINVFDVPELNLKARVNQGGFVALPLIGGVPAAGLTEAELKADITKRLTSYVRNPQVSIAVSEFGSQKVAVLGAVARPMTYPLKKGANSILELLSEAGGINEHAGTYVNFIPSELSGVSSSGDIESRARFGIAQQQTAGISNAGPALTGASAIEVGLDQVMGTTGGIPVEIPVRGGDMIIVPEAGKVQVDGEVQNPGSFELGRQATLLGALAAGGGITYGAKPDEVEIIRTVGLNTQTRLILDLTKIATGEEYDVRLRNGDVIRVPSDSERRLGQDTFEGITRLINFGVGGSVNLGN